MWPLCGRPIQIYAGWLGLACWLQAFGLIENMLPPESLWAHSCMRRRIAYAHRRPCGARHVDDDGGDGDGDIAAPLVAFPAISCPTRKRSQIAHASSGWVGVLYVRACCFRRQTSASTNTRAGTHLLKNPLTQLRMCAQTCRLFACVCT